MQKIFISRQSVNMKTRLNIENIVNKLCLSLSFILKDKSEFSKLLSRLDMNSEATDIVIEGFHFTVSSGKAIVYNSMSTVVCIIKQDLNDKILLLLSQPQ